MLFELWPPLSLELEELQSFPISTTSKQHATSVSRNLPLQSTRTLVWNYTYLRKFYEILKQFKTLTSDYLKNVILQYILNLIFWYVWNKRVQMESPESFASMVVECIQNCNRGLFIDRYSANFVIYGENFTLHVFSLRWAGPRSRGRNRVPWDASRPTEMNGDDFRYQEVLPSRSRTKFSGCAKKCEDPKWMVCWCRSCLA